MENERKKTEYIHREIYKVIIDKADYDFVLFISDLDREEMLRDKVAINKHL